MTDALPAIPEGSKVRIVHHEDDAQVGKEGFAYHHPGAITSETGTRYYGVLPAPKTSSAINWDLAVLCAEDDIEVI